MANNGWSTGVTANATNLSTGHFFFRLVRGLGEIPEVRGVDTIIPSLAGRVARSRVKDTLRLEAAGFVMGIGSDDDAQQADFRTAVDAIVTLMDPTSAPYAIVATLENGSTRSIYARPINVVWGDDGLPAFQTASLEWESIDPTWTPGGS